MLRPARPSGPAWERVRRGMDVIGGPGRQQLAREGAWVVVGQAAGLLGALVGIRLITTVVPPEVYGEAALLLGVVSFANELFCAPLLQGSLRFYPEARDRGRVAELRRLMTRLLGAGVGTAALGLLAGGALWIGLYRPSVGYAGFVWASALLALNTLRLFETSLLNAARRQRSHGLWNALDTWAKPLAIVGAVLVLGASAATLLLGHVMGAALSNAVFWRSGVRNGGAGVPPDPVWSAGLRRSLFHYAAPLVPLAILGFVMNLSDRYILAGLAGTEAAGLYVAAYGLASRPFVAFAGVVNLTLRPVLFDAVARADARAERRTFGLWLALAGGGALIGVGLVYRFQEPIVQLVLGERFWGAAPLLPWIAGAFALQAVRQSFEGLIFADRRTRLFPLLFSIGAASALAFYALLIPRLGAQGAAIGTFGAFAVSCAATIGFSRAGRHLWHRAVPAQK